MWKFYLLLSGIPFSLSTVFVINRPQALISPIPAHSSSLHLSLKPSPAPLPRATPTPTPTPKPSPAPSVSPSPLPSATPEPTAPSLTDPAPSPQPSPTMIPKSSSHFQVKGNQIFTPEGKPFHFKGVNRPSLEWSREGEHLSPQDYQLIRTWGFNTVRLPLNQKFWFESSQYRVRVAENVAWINAENMNVILDLHWSTKGDSNLEAAQQRMPDEHSIEFWRQVADAYKDNPAVLFELYNEPRDVSPEVWLHGGDSGDGFQAVGMQRLIDEIRHRVGAQNLIILTGLEWGYDHAPLSRAQGENLVYATHVYGEYEGKKTAKDWDKAFGFLIGSHPVIATEFGHQCDGNFSADFIRYMNSKNQSWIAWAWYPGGCGFPSVIENWQGDPSPVGSLIRTLL